MNSMADISDIQQVRDAIQKDKNLICVSIGATYLQERYTDEARGTDDIDFIVYHKRERNVKKITELLINRMISSNCRQDIQSENPLHFRDVKGAKIHIYVQDIGDFELSKEMKKRLDSNYTLAIEDFAFLKLLPTDREKDIDDIIFVLKRNQDFNWDTLFSELKNQLDKYFQKFGSSITRRKVIDIGAELEKIGEKTPHLVNSNVMERMRDLFNYFDSKLTSQHKNRRN